MGLSDVTELRTLRRPSIQNVSLTGTEWKKITISSALNKELLIQLRQSYDCRISFISDNSTYFTLKGGMNFSITSNMYATSNSLSFWVYCASSATLEIVEVAAV